MWGMRSKHETVLKGDPDSALSIRYKQVVVPSVTIH